MTATTRLALTLAALVLAVVAVFAVAMRRGERAEPQAPSPVGVPPLTSAMDAVPVLHQGRIKPLSVASEEMSFAITGKGNFGVAANGSRATALQFVLDLQLHPQAWHGLPLIYTPYIAVQKELGVHSQHVTLDQLERPEISGQLAFAAGKKAAARARGEQVTLTVIESEAALMAERVGEARAVLAGDTVMLAPMIWTAEQRAWLMSLAPTLAEQNPDEPHWRVRARVMLRQLQRVKADGETAVAAMWNTPEADIWWSLADLALRPDPLLDNWPDPYGVRAAAAAWGATLSGTGDQAAATSQLIVAVRTSGDAYVAALRANGAPHLPSYPSTNTIALELTYLRVHPFGLACFGFLLGAALVAVGWLRTGVITTSFGMLCIVVGLTARVALTGMAPVTNLYETLIFVSLIASGLSLVLLRTNGNRLFAVAGGIAAGLCALVGELMPPDFGAHLSQLQPVLRTRFWLWVHVLTIVASYGAFLLAWVMGNIVLFTAVHRQRRVTNVESTAIYRVLQVGVVLVAAGTLLGGMWADQAWGRFWGWDPKEVWALVILLSYLVPLHLRYAGVVGPTALAGWAVYGFLSVIMSWYGVNFLLGVGLHAYATGSGFANSFSTDQVVVLGLSVVQLVVTSAQLVVLRKQSESNPAGD